MFVLQINTLLESYRAVAQQEKAEKERKKYVKRRSHAGFQVVYTVALRQCDMGLHFSRAVYDSVWEKRLLCMIQFGKRDCCV